MLSLEIFFLGNLSICSLCSLVIELFFYFFPKFFLMEFDVCV